MVKFILWCHTFARRRETDAASSERSRRGGEHTSWWRKDASGTGAPGSLGRGTVSIRVLVLPRWLIRGYLLGCRNGSRNTRAWWQRIRRAFSRMIGGRGE